MAGWELSDWASFGGLLFGFLGLVNPVVIWWWKNQVRQPAVDIIPAGFLEIGFTTLGNHVGLRGTLRAVNHDLFVPHASVRARRLRDDRLITLPWRLVREDVLKQTAEGASESVMANVPRGFLLVKDQPYPFNIGFTDLQVLDDNYELFMAVRGRLAQQLAQAAQEAGQPLSLQEAWDLFSQGPDHRRLLELAQRHFFWEEGDFELTMEVMTSRPTKTFQQHWPFTLTRYDLAELADNPQAVVMGWMGFAGANLKFAFPPYHRRALTAATPGQ